MQSNRLNLKTTAPGFVQDALKLLDDFGNENSMEFSVFSTIWRKHQFSLIFMGRTNEDELYEFTYEVFRISLQFLQTSSFHNKVGAIFLMYALFRNQKLEPCVKIRIGLWQWEIIKDVYEEAMDKKCRSVQYVIEYLINNAFSFVGKHTLMGPLIDYVQTSSKLCQTLPVLKVKDDFIEYSASNNIQELMELQRDYSELKKELKGTIKVNQSGSNGDYEQIHKHFNDVLNSAERCTRKRKQRESNEKNTIGLRRNQIKATAFSIKSLDFWGRKNESIDDDVSSDDDQILSVTSRRKRVPKSERKAGRRGKKAKAVKKPQENEFLTDFTDDIKHLELQYDLPGLDLKKGSARFSYYENSS